MMQCIFLLFDNYETLDVFGPVEALGMLPETFELSFCSEKGGPVKSAQGAEIVTEPFPAVPNSPFVLVVPGGTGTRTLVDNGPFIAAVKQLARAAKYVLCVCTGSALLAKTGLLNGKNATTNKLAFAWVALQGPAVNWQKSARWVVDGKFYTSSGVSAGIDMALGFIGDIAGDDAAVHTANQIEYVWNKNKDNDPFAI